MKDFNYYAPTQVAFGRKAEQATVVVYHIQGINASII